MAVSLSYANNALVCWAAPIIFRCMCIYCVQKCALYFCVIFVFKPEEAKK